MVNLNKSIEEITGENWGSSSDSSFLVLRCHELRKKPLKDFTVEDLRIMIGQHFELDLLLPIAIQILEKNPLAEGDFYPGDLLSSVLKVKRNYWQKNKVLHKSVADMLKTVKFIPKELYDPYKQFIVE